MLDWDDLRFFSELARRGSLSEAARRLGADHSTVARRITRFETAMGLKLFDRLPRGYALTAEGERILERVGPLEEAVFSIERLAGSSGEIEGLVRISAPPALASQWLVPRMAPLRSEYPALVLDIAGISTAANLARREADLAIRLSRPEGDALVARKLGDLRFGHYGARSYVEATQEADWSFLGYNEALETSPQQRWSREMAGERPFVLLTNDLASLISGARAGMGVAALPHILAQDDPELTCVADGPETTREIWLVVHPDLRRSARVRVVMNHLVAITAPLRS